MYGQLKFPILANTNHSVVVSGMIEVSGAGAVTHDIHGVESIEVHESNGEGKIKFKGGVRKIHSVIINIADSVAAEKVRVVDISEGEVDFIIEDSSAAATEACKLSIIAVVATA